jgi:dihydroorotase
VFEEDGALDKLEAFASLNGPNFYGLPPNERRVVLVREDRQVPEALVEGPTRLVPFHAGRKLAWHLAGYAD